MLTACLWNSLYQIRLKSKDWKPKNLKILEQSSKGPKQDTNIAKHRWWNVLFKLYSMSLFKKTSSSRKRCSNNLYSILITKISFTTLTCQSYIGTKLSFWFPLYSTKIGIAYMKANITAIQSNQWLKILGCFLYDGV